MAAVKNLISFKFIDADQMCLCTRNVGKMSVDLYIATASLSMRMKLHSYIIKTMLSDLLVLFL